MRRPNGPPSLWSLLQASRWIRHLARQGDVRFVDHAYERGAERGVSIEEVLRTIESGRPVQKESSVVQRPEGDFDEERVRFTHSPASRPDVVIGVVAGISEVDPKAVVITCWADKR